MIARQSGKLGFVEVFGKRLAPRTCEGGVSPNGLTGGVKTGAEAAYNSKQLDKLKFEADR